MVRASFPGDVSAASSQAWMRALIASTALLYSGACLAKSGALPRGDLTEIDAGKVTTPTKNNIERPKDCTDIIANPLGLPMEYDADGTHVWWFARLGLQAGSSKEKSSESNGQEASGKLKSILYSVDVKKRVALPHVRLETAEPIALLMKKDALSVISFESPSQGRCFEGWGTLIDLSIDKKSEGAVQQKGNYLLLTTPAGRRIFDKTRRGIIETDPISGQSRVLRKVSEGERPLYFNPVGHQLLTYVQSKSGHEIVTYAGDKTKEQSRDKLPSNTRPMIAPGGAKLALEIRGDENAFKIHEMSSWNGAGGQGVYKISLPRGYSPHSARVDVDPASGLALVTGESIETREKWQRVFVYRYRLGKLAATVDLEGTQFPHLAAISPKGDTIFVEVRSTLSHTTVGGRVVDVKTGKVRPIQITLPPYL